jgi:hypothetical protein
VAVQSAPGLLQRSARGTVSLIRCLLLEYNLLEERCLTFAIAHERPDSGAIDSSKGFYIHSIMQRG